ncbi:hypothetical protein [Oerskovia jenensis]|uniref:hypothetical protein n=1 Tax=Oerskovia jenensis TaxID=162169 RepID=UPI0031DC2336
MTSARTSTLGAEFLCGTHRVSRKNSAPTVSRADRGTPAPPSGNLRYGDDRTTQHHRTTSTTHNSTHPRELAAAS